MVDISAKEAAARVQMDDVRLREIESQMVTLASTLEGVQVTRTSLNNLPSKKTEAFIPVGSGLYLPAKVGESKKVMIDVGASAVVEKDSNEALELLDKREKQIREMIDKLRESAEKISKNSAILRQKLQTYFEQQKKEEKELPVIG